MSRPLESQLWHAVYGLYWEVARGYHTFVLTWPTSGKCRTMAHPVARAIRALVCC
jgi:hypothetical protein